MLNPAGRIPLKSDICDAGLCLGASSLESSGCGAVSLEPSYASSSSLSGSCREATRGIGGRTGGAGETGDGEFASGIL